MRSKDTFTGKSEEAKLNERLNALADELDILQSKENGGQGVYVLRRVVATLKVGGKASLERVRSYVIFEADKLLVYDEPRWWLGRRLWQEFGLDTPSVFKERGLSHR